MIPINSSINIKVVFRFSKKINFTDSCWLWTASGYAAGYGGLLIDGKKTRAHRYSYEIFCGPIKRGLFVCHSCDNPSCVNPEHLWVGTHSENMIDSVAKKRHHETRKTHCPKGHEYSKQNTRIYENRRGIVGRFCRACQEVVNKNRYI